MPYYEILPHRVKIIWMASDNSTHSTTTELTKAWSAHDLDAIIGSYGRCSTQLELAAAWAIPAFTSVSDSPQFV